MYRIKILGIGKTKEGWLSEAVGDLTKRLRGRLEIDEVYLKSDEQLIQAVSDERQVILLDEKGMTPDSPSFSKLLISRLEEGGSRLTFVIGGADGLPAQLKKSSHEKLSLSSMTLTHQMVRLLLVEQIYRALEIDRGSPYHR